MNLLGLWWDDPWMWLGLLAIPLLLWRTISMTKPGRIGVSDGEGVRQARSFVASAWWAPDAMRMLCVGALVLAAARPQTVDERVVKTGGVDIMLALDMSGSMNSVDMTRDDLEQTLSRGIRPDNRFDIARRILKNFVRERRQDRVGLVIFGQQAWLKYPLTVDYSRLIHTLDGLILDGLTANKCTNGCTISGKGTTIGDALGRAYNRLRRSKAKSKLVLLITDGKQEGGKMEPRAVSRHVRDLPDDEKVRIFTFLVGNSEETYIPVYDFRGREVLGPNGLPQYQPNRRPFPVDPDLLQEIARMTDGQFYKSYNEEKFKKDIKDLEKTVFETQIKVDRADVFMPLLWFALLFLGLEWLLKFTRWRGVV